MIRLFVLVLGPKLRQSCRRIDHINSWLLGKRMRFMVAIHFNESRAKFFVEFVKFERKLGRKLLTILGALVVYFQFVYHSTIFTVVQLAFLIELNIVRNVLAQNLFIDLNNLFYQFSTVTFRNYILRIYDRNSILKFRFQGLNLNLT
jgi:hypothetical protein